MVCLSVQKMIMVKIIKVMKETESLLHSFRSKWSHIKFLKIAIPIDTIDTIPSEERSML